MKESGVHTKANRDSWKIEPRPAERQALDLKLFFSDLDGERLLLGHIPADMDDKWFIYAEDGWLYFHHSWTGHCIYGVKIDGYPSGVRIVECWASRNKDQYNSPGAEAEKSLIAELISSKLLG